MASGFTGENKKSKLTKKLVMRAIVAGFVASILASSIQLYLNYQYRHNLAEKNIAQIGNTFLPALSQSIWAFDLPQLRLNLQTIAQQQYISSVKLLLEDDDQHEFYGSEVEGDNFIEKRFEVTVTNQRNQQTQLGTLILKKDFQEEVDDLLIDSFYSFIGNTMIIIVIAITITQIFRALVTRRLTSIALKWGKVSEHDLRMGFDQSAFNTSKRRQSEDSDELDTLENVIELLFRTGATALKEAEEKEKTLIKLKGEADSANTAKSEFLANMSHEIRTPMNGVAGLAELLEQTSLDSSQLNLVNHIRRSSAHLLEIINDILDFSKIEADQLEISLKTTNLDKLLSDLAVSFSAVALQKNIQWICPASPPLHLNVQADEIRIKQVLTNLIGNAIKFTETGEVSVSCECLGRYEQQVTVRFTIEDTGVGIPAESHSSLFDRFTQADNSSSRAFGGTGLGLAICKKLINLMEGEIFFDSSPQGSKFWFELPLELTEELPLETSEMGGLAVFVLGKNQTQNHYIRGVLDQAGVPNTVLTHAHGLASILESRVVDPQHPVLLLVDESLADDVQDQVLTIGSYENRKLVLMTQNLILENDDSPCFDQVLSKPVQPGKFLELLNVNRSEQGSLEAEQGEGSYFENLTVLLVEDNQVNLLVAEKMLQRLNVSYLTAQNGGEALSVLNSHDVDLIFMDCQMPIMDGYQATHEIRQGRCGDNKSQLPIIALTANALTGDKEKCLAAGMDDYIAKPVSLDDFQSVLSRWCKGKIQTRDALSLDSESREVLSPVEERFDYPKMLALMMEDEELVVAVLKAFLVDVVVTLSDIKGLVEKGDYPELAKMAHKIKGAAGNLSAYRFKDIAFELEKASKLADQDKVASLLPRLIRAHEELEPLLRDKVSELDK